MVARRLDTLKRGTWFVLKPIEFPKETQVFVRGEYSREDRKYFCGAWSDISRCKMLKGDTLVYTDFTF